MNSIACLICVVDFYVTELSCQPPKEQSHGHRTRCPEPFLYMGTCQFECDAGYQLPPGGTSLIECIVKTIGGFSYMAWSKPPTGCQGTCNLQTNQMWKFIFHSNFSHFHTVQLDARLFVCDFVISWCDAGRVTFTEMACSDPPEQVRGHRSECPEPFQFGSVCAFECDAGFLLPSGGVSTLQCVTVSTGHGLLATQWDLTPTPCTGG